MRNGLEWIYWLLPETIKHFLVAYGILGLKIREGRKKYIALVYLLVGIPLIQYLGWSTIEYRTFWVFVFLWTCFKERPGKTVQIFMLQYVTVCVVDMLLLAIVINVFGVSYDTWYETLNHICDFCGIVVWMGISRLVWKKRRNIYHYIASMTWKLFFLLFGMVVALAVMAACIQGALTKNMPEEIQRVAFLASLIAMLFLMVSGGLLVYLNYVRRELEGKNRISRISLELQRKYYEQILEQDQKQKRFRHDFQNHILALENLYEQKKWKEMGEYLYSLTSSFQNIQSVANTGNSMADYFFNGMLDKLSKTTRVHYRQSGKFSEALPMETMDFCIFFSNALDNARHAMEGQEEGEVLLEIKQYKNIWYWNLGNTVSPQAMAMLKGDKKKKPVYSYGTQNMKTVIEKYNGEVSFDYEDGMFWVRVELKENGNGMNK